MNNLKVRAALFTAMVFAVMAASLALLILAEQYQDTQWVKFALLAAGAGYIGYVIYSVKLDELEDHDRKITDIARRIAEKQPYR